MEAVKVNTEMVSDMEKAQNDIRKKVLDSYQDMLAGNGRNYKEFFAEMESRYRSTRKEAYYV